MSHRSNMGRLVLASVMVAGLIAAYVGLALTQPFGLQATSHFRFVQSSQPVTLSWPSFGEGAVGALGYDVLATHGDQRPLPTASVIKVLTALAVLHEKPLDAHAAGPLITITADDVASYNQQVALGGSVVNVQAGEQLSERQALEALLLPSANNMAATLARWAFGSVDSYLTYANHYARELGMTETVVTDPSGLASSTVATPSDLVRLGEAALANPALAAIVREPSATIPVQGVVQNYNALLNLQGIVGIKTGNSDADHGCFLLAAQRTVGTQNITIVAVLMNAPNLDDALYQTLPLLYSTAQSFIPLTIATKGQALASYDVPWSMPVKVIPAQDITYLAWQDSTTTATVTLPAIYGTTSNGHNVGSVTVRNSRLKQTESLPLQLESSIPTPSVFWRLLHPL